jgi:hypothetical protein
MPLADRFPEYVGELHELSDSYRLPHGKAEDLPRLLEAFHTRQDFATDFGCVMHSIVLRENFHASETELLTLIAVACAGEEPDETTPQFSDVIEELRGILQRSLAHRVMVHRADRPAAPSTEVPEKVPEVSSVETEVIETEVIKAQEVTAEAVKAEVVTAQEVKPEEVKEENSPKEETRPEFRGSRQVLNIQDAHDRRNRVADDSVLFQRSALARDLKPSPPVEAAQEPERALSFQTVPFHDGLETLPGKEDASRSLDHSLTYSSGLITDAVPAKRPEPRAAEIVAEALIGLVVVLLCSAGSLPVYRARVSVYLPSANAGVTSYGSQDAALMSGELTKQVAERMLERPHAKPILRQDMISRGMRLLHLGGNETILYADLVAQTAHRVKVTHLQPQNLYAITCDSWSAQFAATFCNELTDLLNDQVGGGAERARTIDAALRPGREVYPHWYLLGSAGLADGCLVGVLLGFRRRPMLKPIAEDDLGT